MPPNPQNLIPFDQLPEDEQRRIRQLGAEASHKVQREKKLVSTMMAELLAEEHDIKIEGELCKLSGEKLLKRVWLKIMAQGGAPAVSLTKVFVEATEGSKIEHTGTGLSEFIKALRQE
jgi:hypothetical protein